MLTDYLMDKYLGSRISACSLTGKYLGYGMNVLLIFAYIIPVTQYLLFEHSYGIYNRGGATSFLGLTTTASSHGTLTTTFLQ